MVCTVLRGKTVAAIKGYNSREMSWKGHEGLKSQSIEPRMVSFYCRRKQA